MGDLYRQHLDTWREEGGTFFVGYSFVGNWGSYGYWGALEYQDQAPEDAPKYQAYLDFIEDQPRWWD
jgi:hypothetical protein